MENRHTKGEWEFIAPAIVSVETKEEIALIKAMSTGTSRQDESLANAKLIAAVPELLKVCLDILADDEQDGVLLPTDKVRLKNAINKATL